MSSGELVLIIVALFLILFFYGIREKLVAVVDPEQYVNSILTAKY